MIRPNNDKVVVTHRPSGIQAYALLSVYRNQHKAKEAALKLLRSRMWAASQIILSKQELTWEYLECTNENSQTKS